MRIHPLAAGEVVLKRAFLHPGTGLRRRLDLLLPGPWSGPMPIRAWLVEHGAERILVDMGDTAEVKDAPFARHTITREDELPRALDAAGFSCEAVTTAVVTHLHPDHFHGAVHLSTPVLVNDAEWSQAMSFRGRVFQRLSGVPLPGGIDFRPVALDAGAFGAFAASRSLTTDGRVLLVSTPGHTPGHASVIAVDDQGRHVLLAGDATDTLEQLHVARTRSPPTRTSRSGQSTASSLTQRSTQRSTSRRTTPTHSLVSQRARRSRSSVSGLSDEEIVEILMQVSVYAGWGRALDGLRAPREVFEGEDA